MRNIPSPYMQGDFKDTGLCGGIPALFEPNELFAGNKTGIHIYWNCMCSDN